MQKEKCIKKWLKKQMENRVSEMFPRTIKIGGLVYSIEKVEKLQNDELIEGLAGIIDYTKLTIRLEKDLHEQMLNQTLIHEITHGAFEEAGLEQDEDTVNKISKVFFQILLDNDFNFLKPDEKEVSETTYHGKEESKE